MSIEARIAELGLTLPEPAKPVASYVSFVRSGDQVTISGQLSNDANGGIKGTVGVDVTPEQAVDAARLCGLHDAGPAVLARMRQDLVFDAAAARGELGYAPRRFMPEAGMFDPPAGT